MASHVVGCKFVLVNLKVDDSECDIKREKGSLKKDTTGITYTKRHYGSLGESLSKAISQASLRDQVWTMRFLE